MGGKKRFDFFCVLGLVLSEILDIPQLFFLIWHIISLVNSDVKHTSASKHNGIIIMPAVLPTAGCSDDLIGFFAKEPPDGFLQRLGLFFAVHRHCSKQ